MKTSPIKAKPALWNVTTQYLNKADTPAMNFLQTMPTVGEPMRKILTLESNGNQTVYTHGKNGEYWNNGQALTKTLQVLAKTGKSKIKIY